MDGDDPYVGIIRGDMKRSGSNISGMRRNSRDNGAWGNKRGKKMLEHMRHFVLLVWKFDPASFHTLYFEMLSQILAFISIFLDELSHTPTKGQTFPSH